MSRHNPDTAVYEETIRDLRSRLRESRQLVEDYSGRDCQRASNGHNAVRCCCDLCNRARILLGKD